MRLFEQPSHVLLQVLHRIARLNKRLFLQSRGQVDKLIRSDGQFWINNMRRGAVHERDIDAAQDYAVKALRVARAMIAVNVDAALRCKRRYALHESALADTGPAFEHKEPF